MGKKNLQREISVFVTRMLLKSSQKWVEKNSCILQVGSIPQSFRIRRCQGCQSIWSRLCLWSCCWSSWSPTQSSEHKVPWPGSPCCLLPEGTGGMVTVYSGPGAAQASKSTLPHSGVLGGDVLNRGSTSAPNIKYVSSIWDNTDLKERINWSLLSYFTVGFAKNAFKCQIPKSMSHAESQVRILVIYTGFKTIIKTEIFFHFYLLLFYFVHTKVFFMRYG